MTTRPSIPLRAENAQIPASAPHSPMPRDKRYRQRCEDCLKFLPYSAYQRREYVEDREGAFEYELADCPHCGTDNAAIVLMWAAYR